MSSGSPPTSHGLMTVTIWSAIWAGPGPGLERNAFPSMPSSVVTRRTPSGIRRPAGPKLAAPDVDRSCRTTVTSVIRTSGHVTLAGLADPDRLQEGGRDRAVVLLVSDHGVVHLQQGRRRQTGRDRVQGVGDGGGRVRL